MSRPYLDEETEQVLRRLPLRHHRSSCVLCHCRHGRLQRWSVGVVPKMILRWDKSRKKLACDWPWGMYVPNVQSSQPWKDSKDVQKALAVGSRPLSLSSLGAVKGRHQCCVNPASRPHGENRDPAEPRMRNRSGETHRKTCGFAVWALAGAVWSWESIKANELGSYWLIWCGLTLPRKRRKFALESKMHGSLLFEEGTLPKWFLHGSSSNAGFSLLQAWRGPSERWKPCIFLPSGNLT